MQPDDPMQFLPHLGNGPARFQLLPNVRPQRPQFFLVESGSGGGALRALERFLLLPSARGSRHPSARASLDRLFGCAFFGQKPQEWPGGGHLPVEFLHPGGDPLLIRDGHPAGATLSGRGLGILRAIHVQ